MDYLKEGIYLRQVAQVDPLTAWQREGFQMFEQMLESINHDFVRFITQIEVQTDEVASEPEPVSFEGAVTNAPVVEEAADGVVTASGAVVAGAVPNEKLGRNEPCWCGSGKKFKQCHGRP
jgi:preprotein translocase subunit SecA